MRCFSLAVGVLWRVLQVFGSFLSVAALILSVLLQELLGVAVPLAFTFVAGFCFGLLGALLCFCIFSSISIGFCLCFGWGDLAAVL
jgi:hypothetical protein